MSELAPQTDTPTQQETQPPPAQQPQSTQPRYNKPEPRPRKVYDINLDAWYYAEINKREDPELFRNYQINPYTKKTLDYVTPKITERRKQFPKDPCASSTNEKMRPLSEDDQHILKSFDLVKRAMDKSVNPPKVRFCEPQTEAMRLGWFPPTVPPPTNLSCMYVKTCWSPTPCCYFHPKPEDNDETQNELSDERFRAVHRMAEFIRTETQLKKFDSIMNPEGYRGKVKTDRKQPGSRLKK